MLLNFKAMGIGLFPFEVTAFIATFQNAQFSGF